jgi:hypothetical protein
VSAPRLATPASIVLTQTSPGAWTVELTIAGVRRYLSVGVRTRRAALASVVDWLEQQEGAI